MRFTSMKKRLGDILVDVGIITPEQLSDALEIQRRSGGKLGSILSQMGVINEEVMLAFLGKQCGVPYISLAEYGDITIEVLRSLPESVIRSQNLIPLSKEGNTVTVAMSDPFNVFAVDDIKLMTGYDVQVAIAAESDIRAAIVKYFSHLPETTAPLVTDPYLSDLQKGEVPSEQLQNAFLSQAISGRASSVYLEPQSTAVRVRQRVDGQLQERANISKQLALQLISRFKEMAGLDVNEMRIPQEARVKTRISGRELDLKISVVPTIFGERLRLDILDPLSSCVELGILGFETEALSRYKKLIESLRGLVLITGPFDSGKTTTLYSSLAHLNSPDRDILTVEDPVEFVLPGITQVQVDARTGVTIAANLQAFLRQSPDILMVSEAKNHWAAKLAVSAAVEGRLALSSLSMANAEEALKYLFDTGMDPFLISSALTTIVSQRLMRMTCPACKEAYEIPSANLHSFIGDTPLKAIDSKITLWRGKGCTQCNHTGYIGRTGIFEVLQIDDNLRSLIAGRCSDGFLKEAVKSSTPSLLESAWRKVYRGITTVEEMMRIVRLAD
jgi:type IV pilus assembly protein PilB